MHTRMFKPLADDCFTSGFHHAGTDKQSLTSKIRILHSSGIGFEIVRYFFHRWSYLGTSSCLFSHVSDQEDD